MHVPAKQHDLLIYSMYRYYGRIPSRASSDSAFKLYYTYTPQTLNIRFIFYLKK